METPVKAALPSQPITPAFTNNSNPLLTPVSSNCVSSGITISRVANVYSTPSSNGSRSASSELDDSASQAKGHRSPSVKRKPRKQSEEQRRKNKKIWIQNKRAEDDYRRQEQALDTLKQREKRTKHERKAEEQKKKNRPLKKN